MHNKNASKKLARQALNDSSAKSACVCEVSVVDRGAYFFDYGNSFMKAVFNAGAREISKNGIDEKDGFIFPS
jgi:urocanate hydratase